MNTQITLDHLSELKLQGMARAYQAVLGRDPTPNAKENRNVPAAKQATLQCGFGTSLL